MKTMYLAVYGYHHLHFAVEKTEIVKETENYVFIMNWAGREYKHAKTSKDACYFDTEKEAWQWLYGKACEEHNTAQRRADEKLFIANKIFNKLKKHL